MKRLIFCADGTWNQPGKGYPTNVEKLAQAFQPQASDGIQQVLHYDQGIGTNNGLDKVFGGAFGWGIDENIQDGYRFLAENYEAGDEVYLFGFSRGAYTVRSLAGFIYCSGLLPPERLGQMAAAYRLYRNAKLTPSHPQAEQFRRQNQSQQIAIAALGCWDTVGALGVPQIIPWLPADNLINRKYRFHDTQLNRKIQHALHAVAIDERRRAFNVTPMQPSAGAETQIREVWFPGDHGCTGGGRKDTKGLSDAALQWLVETITGVGLGLEFDLGAIADGVDPHHTAPFDSSISGIYRFIGELDRPLPSDFDCLHLSSKQRWRDVPSYRPINLVQPFQAELDAWAAANPA